jgi:hypothetical protein
MPKSSFESAEICAESWTSEGNGGGDGLRLRVEGEKDGPWNREPWSSDEDKDSDRFRFCGEGEGAGVGDLESCALERAEDRGRFRLQVGAEEDGREAGGPWAPLEDGGDGFSCWRVKTCCFFNLNGVALAGFPSGPRISNGLSPSSMAAEAFESFESFGFELPDFMPMTMTCLGRLDNKNPR